jgi:hypothetical protein
LRVRAVVRSIREIKLRLNADFDALGLALSWARTRTFCLALALGFALTFSGSLFVIESGSAGEGQA